MVNYAVPFVGNTPDDTHCFQAALKMVLEYFAPEVKYSFPELAEATAKGGEDFGTWRLAAFFWLQEQGYDVQFIEPFDYERFLLEGERYIEELYGPEGAAWHKKHSNIEHERLYAQKLLGRVGFHRRVPTLQDIKSFLENGYLVITLVNARALYGQEGYGGHYELIKGFEGNDLLYHEPGLPPEANQRVAQETFYKAWAYPTERAANILAIKK